MAETGHTRTHYYTRPLLPGLLVCPRVLSFLQPCFSYAWESPRSPGSCALGTYAQNRPPVCCAFTKYRFVKRDTRVNRCESLSPNAGAWSSSRGWQKLQLPEALRGGGGGLLVFFQIYSPHLAFKNTTEQFCARLKDS